MVLGLWKLICTTNPLREKQPHKVTLNFNDHLKKNVIYQKLGKHFATYNLNAERMMSSDIIYTQTYPIHLRSQANLVIQKIVVRFHIRFARKIAYSH